MFNINNKSKYILSLSLLFVYMFMFVSITIHLMNMGEMYMHTNMNNIMDKDVKSCIFMSNNESSCFLNNQNIINSWQSIFGKNIFVLNILNILLILSIFNIAFSIILHFTFSPPNIQKLYLYFKRQKRDIVFSVFNLAKLFSRGILNTKIY